MRHQSLDEDADAVRKFSRVGAWGGRQCASDQLIHDIESMCTDWVAVVEVKLRRRRRRRDDNDAAADAAAAAADDDDDDDDGERLQ
jgi:hypothetical protein